MLNILRQETLEKCINTQQACVFVCVYLRGVTYECVVKNFISYLGVKSWDLQVCDRASTITHVDREKKNSAYYNNKMFYFFLG